MSEQFLPEETLRYLSLRFRHLDGFRVDDHERILMPRPTKNEYYNSDGFECFGNFRRTSKLLNPNEPR